MRKFTNSFNDSKKAIVDIEKGTVFWFVFSSDSHIVAENIENYRLATEEEITILNKSSNRFQKLPENNNLEIKPETIKELIQFNEDWISDLKKSLNNPLQKAVGTDHLKIKIIELETELKKLREQL